MTDSPARKARLRAARDEKILALREAGSCCSNCESYWPADSMNPQPRCGRTSDFYGDTIIKPIDLCVHWSTKVAPKEKEHA